MIVDGKSIARQIYESIKAEVALLPRPPVLAAITCAPNFETKKYLELKKRKAAEVGITLQVIELPETATTKEAVDCVLALAPQVDGIVVQLPFPAHIDREDLLAAVPVEKDPDGFSYSVDETSCLPPVVGAIIAIAKLHGIEWAAKNVVVVGFGRLVGKPAAIFASRSGAEVMVVHEDTRHVDILIPAADILISGVGKPHFITPDMVKEGAIVFDAGTSEDGGVLAGDGHPDVAHKAALFTPVPGGIGPVTVAVLLQNLLRLAQKAENT